MEDILFVTFVVFVMCNYPAETGGPIYSKCAPAGVPLSIQCDTWSIIYVRQTMYSEYYGVPNVNCQLPSYSSLCHTFSNSSDFYYNGKYRAEHTFVSERLTFVGQIFGVNCNDSSTVRVVQILYECLTEMERPSICEDKELVGEVDGMLFNPGFPDPVRQQYGGCSCRISATDWGVIRLSAIIINPVHPHTGNGRWRLNVKINEEHDYSLDQMYRLSSDIGIADTNSLTLGYSNGGDTTFLPVMVPRVPTGFWIKYSAFPSTSRVHVVCSVKQKDEVNLSPGVIAVISSIAGVCVFVTGLAVFLVFRRVSFKGDRNKSSLHRHAKQVGGSQVVSSRSATFSEVNKEFYFLRRCNTLSSISRYNSLPPNFIFQSKKRKLSSAKSKDSGIAIIDIHRNESFKHAVNSETSEDRNVQAAKNEEGEERMNQEVTSLSEAGQSEVELPGVSDFGILQYLSVIGTTDDEVDV